MFGRKKPEDPARRSPAGGRSAPVFSYYSNRSDQDLPRRRRDTNIGDAIKKRAPKAWWVGYLPAIISIMVVIGCAMYATTLAVKPRIHITTIDGKPAATQDVKIYETAAQKILKKSLFSRSKLTIDTDKIAKELQDQFPELGDVIVTVPLIGRQPIIDAQPAVPALVLSGQGGVYVVDINGTPVLKASELKSSIKDKLPAVTDDSGSEVQMGKQLLPTDLVRFIGQIDAQLKAKQVRVQSYSLPALANELHVRLADIPYVIKCNIDTDARLQVGTYLAVSEKLKAEGITPAEYIDVRIEERAYYR